MFKNEDVKAKDKIKSTKKKNSFQGQNPSTLYNVRIIQKNLVYVIGLSGSLANKDTLSKQEYFGQYGTIIKVVVNKNKAYNPDGPNGPSYSAYISYTAPLEASLAILSVDNIEVDEHTIRASFGTTKYCTFFLKNCDCPNKDCLYLHEMAEEGDIICRDDMNTNKNIFYEQQLLAIKLADLYNPEIKKKITQIKKSKYTFPSTEMLYTKDIVIENNPEFSYQKKFNSDSHYNNRFTKKYEYDDYNDNYYNESLSNTNTKYLCNSRFDNQNEEVEYILVREKSDKFRKNKSRKNTMSSKKEFNRKDNKIKSEDDSNLMDRITSNTSNSDNYNNNNGNSLSSGENSSKNVNLNLNEQFNLAKENSNTKSNSIDNINIKESSSTNSSPSLNNLLIPIKNIFRKREISRFEFVNKSLNKLEINPLDNTNEVPDFISDMIYKKISSFTFFKKFNLVKNLNNDLVLFEKQLKSNYNNSWAQFIKINHTGKSN